MISEVRDAIISALAQATEATVRPYYGEVADPEKPEINSHHLPLIFVDFVGDESDGELRRLFFNLYFVQVAFSANDTYRSGAHDETFAVMEAADRALRKVPEANVMPRRSKKIFDDRTAKGYLTIYARAVEAHITDEGVHGWNVE
jgi:hypothetical protein